MTKREGADVLLLPLVFILLHLIKVISTLFELIMTSYSLIRSISVLFIVWHDYFGSISYSFAN